MEICIQHKENSRFDKSTFKTINPKLELWTESAQPSYLAHIIHIEK